MAFPQSDLSVTIVVSVYGHDDNSTSKYHLDDRRVKTASWNASLDRLPAGKLTHTLYNIATWPVELQNAIRDVRVALRQLRRQHISGITKHRAYLNSTYPVS